MAQSHSQHSLPEPAVTMRIVLVAVLAVTFVGTLRWAMNVTQANARQVSRNLSRMQNHIVTTPKTDETTNNTYNSIPGPTLEPEESVPDRGRRVKKQR